MTTDNFEITQDQLDNFLELYPDMRNNSDIGRMAVEIVKLYFQHRNPKTTFPKSARFIDLTVEIDGLTENFEIKGTADSKIAWNKLKVSSTDSYEALIGGMRIIRVSNVGKKKVDIHFLKHGEDFILEEEARWTIKQLKR